jgi:alkanesulfonate monooxygenase SsuD/methylene tetrahydromethanopterin reductase-like flavin-dependent oxidoreductase (luciferase family)
VARLEEALTIIRLLWESGGRPVSYTGKFWTLRDAVFNLPLYKGRAPRIWIAAHAPRMLRLTGRFGDGWVPAVRVKADEYGRRLGAIPRGGRRGQAPVRPLRARPDAPHRDRREQGADPRPGHEEPTRRGDGAACFPPRRGRRTGNATRSGTTTRASSTSSRRA